MVTYITPAVYNHARLNRNTVIGNAVFNALDTEAIQGIVLDSNTFYFEHNTHHAKVSQRVYDWIVKYLTAQGFEYLYRSTNA